MRPKYKIVKKPRLNSVSLDLYHVYYRYFGFLWLKCHTDWTKQEAEDWITWHKRCAERKKLKPEHIGYY